MPPAGFESPVPASGRLQTHALDRAATGISITHYRFPGGVTQNLKAILHIFITNRRKNDSTKKCVYRYAVSCISSKTQTLFKGFTYETTKCKGRIAHFDGRIQHKLITSLIIRSNVPASLLHVGYSQLLCLMASIVSNSFPFLPYP